MHYIKFINSNFIETICIYSDALFGAENHFSITLRRINVVSFSLGMGSFGPSSINLSNFAKLSNASLLGIGGAGSKHLLYMLYKTAVARIVALE